MFSSTTTTILLSLLASSSVHAIDFTSYAPQPGVQAAFQPFLNALVTEAESPTATTSYTDYFAADGMQTTLSIHCVGAERITACKQRFLPTDGSMSLVHFPNVTSIISDNSTATVYDSHGRIENDFSSSGGNCSQIYYQTQYTILKKTEGDTDPNLSLTAEGQVYWYHDYVVSPTGVPSDIPCDSKIAAAAKKEKRGSEWVA